MIVSMNVSHFVNICQVLTISHQLICMVVANFGTRCRPTSLYKYGSSFYYVGHNLFTDYTIAGYHWRRWN